MKLNKALRLVQNKSPTITDTRQAYINHACLLVCEFMNETELLELVEKILKADTMNLERLHKIIGI